MKKNLVINFLGKALADIIITVIVACVVIVLLMLSPAYDYVTSAVSKFVEILGKDVVGFLLVIVLPVLFFFILKPFLRKK
jgi:uncharacterized Tic20 family protein